MSERDRERERQLTVILCHGLESLYSGLCCAPLERFTGFIGLSVTLRYAFRALKEKLGALLLLLLLMDLVSPRYNLQG